MVIGWNFWTRVPAARAILRLGGNANGLPHLGLALPPSADPSTRGTPRCTLTTMLRPGLSSPGSVLRELWKERAVLMPGVYDGISAVSAMQSGASALYLTGAGLTNARFGVPDIALATLSEFAQTAAAVCAVTGLPVLSDADTGFGGAWNAYRTVGEMERAGLAGIHLEDQLHPKRCGQLDGKSLVPAEEMAAKVRAAVEAKRDPSFVVCAR
ncbi:hypothetical protein EON82_23700, partial [bacterium]